MYTVLSTVPFVLLGVYPFRQQYRFPRGMTIALLVLSNIAALAVIDAKCLEGLLFGQELARQSCRWTVSAAMAPVLVLLLAPLFLYFRQMAETYGVKYAVSADVPARSAFPEQILTVLLNKS